MRMRENVIWTPPTGIVMLQSLLEKIHAPTEVGLYEASRLVDKSKSFVIETSCNLPSRCTIHI